VKSRKNSSRAALSSAAAGTDESATRPAPKGATWSTWLPRLVRAHSHVPSWAPQLGHIAVTASPSWMSVLLRSPSVEWNSTLMKRGKSAPSAKTRCLSRPALGARRDGQVSCGTRHDPLRAAAVRP
jgi:hypothetical protein